MSSTTSTAAPIPRPHGRDQRKEAIKAMQWQPHEAREPRLPVPRRASMRTVYIGTSEFAASVLRRLYDSPHRPSLVVTRPDRPQGRGRRLAPPPAALAATELGVELFQPDRVNSEEARARIAAHAPRRCACAPTAR